MVVDAERARTTGPSSAEERPSRPLASEVAQAERQVAEVAAERLVAALAVEQHLEARAWCASSITFHCE